MTEKGSGRNHTGPADAETLSCPLSDGRRLGYAVYGDPDGVPLMLFHGTPNSRLMFGASHELAWLLGIRLIAPDRPGIGLSDPKPGRRIVDWPADVTELADHIGVDRFAIAGVSGGGPYAIACARFIPERLHAVGVISGMGPVHDAPILKRPLLPRIRALFELARIGGMPYTMVARVSALAARWWPQTMLSSISLSGPQESSEFMATTAWDALEMGLLDAFRQGHAGPAEELRLLAGAWNFVPEEVRTRVVLWHGEADAIVPVEMTRHLAGRIGGCEAHFIADAGHFLGLSHARSILTTLASLPTTSRAI